LPIGIKDTDRFFNVLKELSGREVPKRHQMQRGRLIDAYVDGHKYLFGKRAIVYGEEDLVIGLVSFLEEIGIHTVLAGSGGESGRLKEELKLVTSGLHAETIVKEGLDFEEMKELIPELKPDLMIGNSKGYYLAREFGIPLVRVGFPIHDRVGAQRVQTLGYNGTQQLFDRVTNAILEYKQNNSPVGYKYM
jgi:nitrogenase molybdenum-iron protein NifN